MLKRHLATDHDLTPADYKIRWGLNADYPLVAPDYANKRKELALQIGLGRKPGAGRKKGSGAGVASKRKLSISVPGEEA